MFAGVRKSGLEGCSAREKGSVLQNITGDWGKNVSKNTTRFSKFISWVSRKTKMSKFFLQYQSSCRDKITDCKILKVSQKKFYDGVLPVFRLQICYKENSPKIIFGIRIEN